MDFLRVNTIQPSFRAGYVTATKSTLADKIQSEIVDTFVRCDEPDLPAPDVNYFVLAGGKGSRFAEYTKFLEPVFGEQNKITMPFVLGDGQKLRIIDFPMYLGKVFLGKSGKYNLLTSDAPSGNFGDVIKFYQANPDKIKDTVLTCGDNVWSLSCKELVNAVNFAKQSDADMMLFGSKQNVNKSNMHFGIMELGRFLGDDIYSVDGLVDKPNLYDIENFSEKFKTNDGYCVSYPGMLYIPKKNMEWILKKLKTDKGFIRKMPYSEGEEFDFIAAIKRIIEMKDNPKVLVKAVDKFVDTGTPSRYLKFLSSLTEKDVQNFDTQKANSVLQSIPWQIDQDHKEIRLNVPEKDFEKEFVFDGEKIAVSALGIPGSGSRIIKGSLIENFRLTYEHKKFLSKFADLSADEKRKYLLSSGMTANVYYIPQYNWVIKMIKENINPEVKGFLIQSLKHEFANLKTTARKKISGLQRGFAFLETSKGQTMLISAYQEGKPISLDMQTFKKKGFEKILNILYELDNERMINFDWNPNNVLMNGNKIKLIDFQWMEDFLFARKNPNIISPPFEIISNMTTFETSTLAPYIVQTGDDAVLEAYLRSKAKYCKKHVYEMQNLTNKTRKFELLKAAVYKAPTQNVLNVEKLRLGFMYNNLMKNFYLAPDLDVPKDRSLSKVYRSQALECAQKLASIKTKGRSKAEYEYLKLMKEYGEYLLTLK